MVKTVLACKKLWFYHIPGTWCYHNCYVASPSPKWRSKEVSQRSHRLWKCCLAWSWGNLMYSVSFLLFIWKRKSKSQGCISRNDIHLNWEDIQRNETTELLGAPWCNDYSGFTIQMSLGTNARTDCGTWENAVQKWAINTPTLHPTSDAEAKEKSNAKSNCMSSSLWCPLGSHMTRIGSKFTVQLSQEDVARKSLHRTSGVDGSILHLPGDHGPWLVKSHRPTGKNAVSETRWEFKKLRLNNSLCKF